jgi:hypothetical protein
MDDPIMDFLRSQARNYSCRVCGANHRASALRKVGQHHNKIVVQVTCAKCQDAFFLHILTGVVEKASRPSPLDEPLREAEPVSPDEVLEVHSYLGRFRGPLSDLLKRR